MEINIAEVANKATKVFTKNGYRLALKQTGLKFKSMPVNAASCDFTVIEHITGSKEKIFSFKDINGKLLQRNRINSNLGTEKCSYYDWFEPQQKTQKNLYRQNIDANSFENFGLRRRDLILNTNENQALQGCKYTVVDINKPSNTVTRTEDERKAIRNGDSKIFVDDTKLSEIVNGKKTKEVFQSSVSKPDDVNQVIETKGFNLSEPEVKNITSNDYFHAVFKNPVDMMYAAKARAFANQGIDKSTPFFIKNVKSGSGDSWYSPCGKDSYVVTTLGSVKRGRKINLLSTLEHEARHGWQFKQVEKLNAGKLTDAKEIEQAKTFKANIENYIDMSEGFEKYAAQPIEKDAYNVSDSVTEKQHSFIDRLTSIFPHATRKTLGE